jgi:hypothetical protein
MEEEEEEEEEDLTKQFDTSSVLSKLKNVKCTPIFCLQFPLSFSIM